MGADRVSTGNSVRSASQGTTSAPIVNASRVSTSDPARSASQGTTDDPGVNAGQELSSVPLRSASQATASTATKPAGWGIAVASIRDTSWKQTDPPVNETSKTPSTSYSCESRIATSNSLTGSRLRTTGQQKPYKDGYEYEQFVADWLRGKGFTEAKVTSKSNDGGVDIIAVNNEGVKYAVQCKMYNGANVGFKAIQEVYTGQHLLKCDKAMVVTTTWFTDEAKWRAKQLGVELHERIR